MAKGGLHGWTSLPDGRVLMRLHEADPTVDCGSIDVLVVGENRRAAVARAKDLGLHGIDLKRNPQPPTESEVRAFLAHDDEMLWRRWDDDDDAWLTLDSWPLQCS